MKEIKAWQVGTLLFPTIQAAQQAELAALFSEIDPGEDTRASSIAAGVVVKHADEVVAILTCALKSKSPRKPRRDIGTKRKPKATGTELEAK